MNRCNLYLFAAMLLALCACGNDTDELAPDTPDGAPSYEQLNPPVPPTDDSSMAPETPGSQQDTLEMPVPAPAGDQPMADDASGAPVDPVTVP